SRDGTVKLWDPAGGKARQTFSGVRGSGIGFSPDGKTLTATGEGRLKQWALAPGQERRALTVGPEGSDSLIVLSPDGKTLAGGLGDNLVRLWDLPDGRERAALRGHTQGVASLAFSPDGKTLAS